MYWIEAVILIKVAIHRPPLAYVVVMMAEALGSESGHAKAKVRHLADIYGEVIWIVVVNYLPGKKTRDTFEKWRARVPACP